MSIGRLRQFFGSKRGMIILVGQLALVLLFITLYSGYHSSGRCAACHADKERMAEFGYPQFAVTREQVQKESRHPNTECRDCHLGNGLFDVPRLAHNGMLRPIVLDYNFKPMQKRGPVKQLTPSFQDRQWGMLLHAPDLSLDPDVGTILYHDRNPETYGFDPAVAEKTCGRSNCHPEQVKQFSTSNMGSNFRQRSMRHWLDMHGPNNCGPSFADTPPTGRAKGDRFSSENTRIIQQQMNIPFTQRQAEDRQKICNICHTGCLDCHYTPSAERGAHSMSRTPPSMNCSGGGRGTFVCHSGTMERRRGDSYLGKELSEPAGLPEDIHVAKKIECVDCHQTGAGGMGHIEREASCQDCHIEVEKAVAASLHKNVSCEACHVSVLGGYEMTSWGNGLVMGRPSPFKKYSLYYGPQTPPVIIKDQQGRWIPVKIWPNSAGFIKEPVDPVAGVVFRWPNGETRDAYAQLGTFSFPGGNNLYLAWLQIDQVGHPLRKSRPCKSCHSSRAQAARVSWEFLDSQGAEPFRGSHRIIADEKGIAITEIKTGSRIIPLRGGRTEDFAAWLQLGDIWKTTGDFSIPKADPKKYKDLKHDMRQAAKRLEDIDLRLKRSEAKGLDVKRLRRKWKEAKAAAVHWPTAGNALIEALDLETREGQR